jgi:trehalose 6-phosphate synthase/phosphatase
MFKANADARRMLIVSNRLPFTIAEEGGALTLKESGGGLVSGLSSYLDSLKTSSSKSKYVWVGWPGTTVEGDEAKEQLKAIATADFSAYPVFLSEEDMENFYLGFCNKTIWPLFHYFPSYARYNNEYWQQYRKVNEIFCEALMEIMRPGDIVWVHDYHLMLLPRMIRDKMPDVPVGFFLHIPFPSYEMFRLLPRKWGTEILEGLLGADLVGFHTHDYTQYFMRSVLRILGYDHNMGQIVAHDRVIKADTFPMGIDFSRFHNAAGSPAVLQEAGEIRAALDRTIDDIRWTIDNSNHP